ncbi:CerR family C-terminal domain-containing protein [Aurantiacibacter poecillastricola]|uniref:CerR family C-terminal domain-containing protein n=1 Tax=Aurantiacibacter poecillastricola TaxID=3064385 RepID=UPI00273D6C89|nr:CerR family C-terminal domain-containing protein [Aurantiacibacter sp. 219JJ12-13]MDP5261371.1 CerR family C-terminal domain-containing protein [Aurantiacibacter sp. 219JJ12-13]
MREKLIHAAIERFGKRGYDGVGTREIAAAVGTPMSSITYHFGGKEGLYHAAAEHIFLQLLRDVGGEQDIPADGAPAEERIDAICGIIQSVAQFMLSPRSAAFALFIGREQQDPSPTVRELMQATVMPMIVELSRQVGMVRRDLDAEEAKAVTIFLFGMAITLRHSRASLGILMGSESFEPSTQAMLLAQLDACARAVLRGQAE